LKLKKYLAVAALILAGIGISGLKVKAQTGGTYNLPNSLCAVQGTSYLYCSQMGTITVNDVKYNVFLSALNITNLYQNPSSAPVNLNGGSFNLQNIQTGERFTMAFTSGTYEDRHLTFNFGPTVAPWNGQFTGTVDLDLVRTTPPPPCRYGCRPYWIDENVVLSNLQ
jgi:hypothetical protein